VAVPAGEVGGGSLSPGVGLQSMLARCSKPRLELGGYLPYHTCI